MDPDGGECRGWTGMSGALQEAQRMAAAWTILLKGSLVSQNLRTSTELAREPWDEKHLNAPGTGGSLFQESSSCHLSSKPQSYFSSNTNSLGRTFVF